MILTTPGGSSTGAHHRTHCYSQFKKAEGEGGDGVFVREGNPYNFCLIEASAEAGKLRKQLGFALELHKDASHKVLAVNGQGSLEGVLVSGGGGEAEGEKVVLTGGELAQLAWKHFHERHFLVVFGTAYGHKLGEAFIRGIVSSSGENFDLRALFAATYFTTDASPSKWHRPATAGGVHVELKRDMTEFLTKTVQPNSPYKVLDSKMGKIGHCTIL